MTVRVRTRDGRALPGALTVRAVTRPVSLLVDQPVGRSKAAVTRR